MVLAVGGIMSAVFLRLIPKKEIYAWQALPGQLSACALFAQQQALTTQKPHRLRLTNAKSGARMVVEQVIVEDLTLEKRYEVAEPRSFAECTLPQGALWERISAKQSKVLEPIDKETSIELSPDGVFAPATFVILGTVLGREQRLTCAIEPFLGSVKRVERE